MKGARVGIAVTLLVCLFEFGSPRVISSTTTTRTCPAIFNFGDSNSDTGSASAAFFRIRLPYGETFFGKPSGRNSDGRLIIDFLAEKLELPYLNGYLDSMGSNFSNGANFAVGGATILPSNGYSPFFLSLQVAQFEQFKERTEELCKQGKDKDVKCKMLPNVDDFSSALYTLDIGNNDFAYSLSSLMSLEAIKQYITSLIDNFESTVEKLHQLGGRAFWIHSAEPIGCIPMAFLLPLIRRETVEKDEYGCIKTYNELAQEFNRQLKQRVDKLRDIHQDSTIIYVDIYSAKYDLVSNATNYGFPDPLGYCLELFKPPCDNPSKYIIWDGIHYTEAASKLVADHIADGRYSDPQIPITQACHHQSYNSHTVGVHTY